MPFKNVIFDRDGVINEVVMRDGGVSSPRTLAEFEILSDFSEFFEQLRPLKLTCFVVSNQPDVSRDLLDANILAAMTDQLGCFQFKEIIYCTHDDRHSCVCRKPKPGMITALLDKYGLERHETIMIGDSKKDVLAGQAAGIKTVYIRRSYNQLPGCEPEYLVDSLREILGIITDT